MPGMYIGRGGISEEHLYPALHAIFRTMFHPLSGLHVAREINILKFAVKKRRGGGKWWHVFSNNYRSRSSALFLFQIQTTRKLER